MSQFPTTEQEGANFAAKAWLRALEGAATIPQNRFRTLPIIIEERAEHLTNTPALLSDHEILTYKVLAARQNQYARWALEQFLERNEVVCLFMPNRPQYLAIWLGISSVGGVVSLLNTSLKGTSLSHCINTVRPRHIIVAADFVEPLAAVLHSLVRLPTIWVYGGEDSRFGRIEPAIDNQSSETLTVRERRATNIENRALCIFTSGTTGLPKAANVSHARILQWSLWFAGMLGVRLQDRMYDCLPMYHSTGGVLAPGAALVGGGSVFIREQFSAGSFWSDVIGNSCTLFQYVGELCRYLLLSTSPKEADGHRLRMACGNGMAADIWTSFASRFRIPRILEFYASTEGGVSLFNAEGRPGAIGRIPPYLAHRSAPALIKLGLDTGEPIRNEQGFCTRCSANDIGEAIGKVANNPSAIGERYEGYTDEQESGKKIIRDVFARGDAWIRTGDLMRRDERGFYYFVDRIGDTFRWKGENVAASEVAATLCGFPGVKHANVYGVAIPFTEGRAGMAAVVADQSVDLTKLREHLTGQLPAYAQPLFLRLKDEAEVTVTLKYAKSDLARQGYDLSQCKDPIFFNDSEARAFIKLDETLYERIQTGQIRL